MRALVATGAGWRGTARSVRWSPMLVVPVVSCVALVVVGAAADPGPGKMSLLGEASLAFTAVTAAFMADDAALEGAPAMPVEAPVRLAARAALALPVVVVGWLLVLAVYKSVTPVSTTDHFADRALAGLAVAAAALALAALGGRLSSVGSPDAAGVGAMACLAVIWRSLPEAWLAMLPSASVLWPVTAGVAVVAIAVGTREPPH